MKSRSGFKSIIFVAVGLALVFTGNSAKAGSSEPIKIWDCTELLDPETKSALTGQERFFAGLFQLPSEYETATDAEKGQLVNQWIKELRGSNNEKATGAAAYLGIAKRPLGPRHILVSLKQRRLSNHWRM
jgi:hypothetical protein